MCEGNPFLTQCWRRRMHWPLLESLNDKTGDDILMRALDPKEAVFQHVDACNRGDLGQPKASGARPAHSRAQGIHLRSRRTVSRFLHGAMLLFVAASFPAAASDPELHRKLLGVLEQLQRTAQPPQQTQPAAPPQQTQPTAPPQQTQPTAPPQQTQPTAPRDVSVRSGPSSAPSSGWSGPDDLPGITYPAAKVVRKKAPELQRKLMGVLEGLQRVPQMTDPHGVSVHPGLTIVPSHALPVTMAEARLLLLPIFKRHNPYVDKQGRYQGFSGDGNILEIKVNDIERLGLNPSLPDALFDEPRQVGTLQGLPIYQFRRATHIVVITAKDRQLWRRITATEYLTRAARAGGPDGEAAKRALGQLAPGAGDRPACLPTRRGEVVGSCEGAQATYIAAWNPGYFDAKRPNAIQLVTIRIGAARFQQPSEKYFQEHPLDPLTQAYKVREQYDWSQLANLVE